MKTYEKATAFIVAALLSPVILVFGTLLSAYFALYLMFYMLIEGPTEKKNTPKNTKKTIE